MRLSEGMRLGAMQLPPIYGPTFNYDAEGRICGACAIGAALYAVGVTVGLWGGDQAKAAYPLLSQPVQMPSDSGLSCVCPMHDAIITLFEHCMWTRERIADWVEAIEHAQTPALEPVPVAVEA